jgi:glycosyltransferase involved in cell wall biosynthesis
MTVERLSAGGTRAAILIISAQFPFPPRSGFARRVAHLATHLAERHDVTVVSYGTAADRAYADGAGLDLTIELVEQREAPRARRRLEQAASVLSPLPYAARSVRTPDMQRAIDHLCTQRRFDAVQLESSVLCALRFPVGVPLLLDEHNLEYEVFERMRQGERSLARRTFNLIEAWRVRRFEQDWWRNVAACAATSEREAEIIHRHAPGTPVAAVPNGVDIGEFRPSEAEVEPESIVFNGLLRYRPNLDAAMYLVDEIWPRVRARRPAARLWIVGRGDPEDIRRLSRPGVVVTGEVPDVRPYLERAAVVVVPVRMGGGTRLKVVEALAMAKPVVTTTLGCEGIDVEHGRDVLIADDADSTAAAIDRLFADPALGARLGSAGRDLAVYRYSWRDAGDRLESLLEDVLAARSRGATDRNRTPIPQEAA